MCRRPFRVRPPDEAGEERLAAVHGRVVMSDTFHTLSTHHRLVRVISLHPPRSYHVPFPSPPLTAFPPTMHLDEPFSLHPGSRDAVLLEILRLRGILKSSEGWPGLFDAEAQRGAGEEKYSGSDRLFYID